MNVLFFIKSFRYQIALIILASVLVIIPILNWPSTARHPEGTGYRLKAYEQINQKILTFQAKVFIGSLIVQGVYPDHKKDNFKLWLRTQGARQADQQEKNIISLLSRFIFAYHFDYINVAKEYWHESHELLLNNSPEFQELMSVLEKIYFSSGKVNLHEQQEQLLKEQLGWFGFLAIWETKQAQQSNVIDKEVFYQQAIESLKTGSKLILMMLGSLLISLICLIVMIYQVVKKKSNQGSQVAAISPGLMIETFTLYLLAGVLVSWIMNQLSHLGWFSLTMTGNLAVNIVFKAAVMTIFLWPLLFNILPNDWFLMIGLKRQTQSSWYHEVLYGVMAFFAFIPVAYLLMLLTMLLTNLLGLDPGQGTHPIIPMLQTIDHQSQLILIFCLVSIAAPIVEEIMFRGVLYSYLKKMFSYLWAIPISGLVFAILHPQGLIGIIPIMGIGCYLAWIREKRQSLIASMVVHGMINGSVLSLALAMFK